MKSRLTYLCKFYALTVLVFIVAKVVFMLTYRGEHPFGVGDAFAVITHGLTLDLSTALYFLALPFLIMIGCTLAQGRGSMAMRWLLRVYDAVIDLIRILF